METKGEPTYMILDAGFFIKLRPLDLVNNNKYLTTQYIVNEIRDVKAREHYSLNKDFIEIKNPTKDSLKKVSEFAKLSNDLSYLSIADLSVISLAYETIINIGKGDLIRKEPTKYQVVDKDKMEKELKKKKKEEQKNNTEEDGFGDEGEGEDDDDGWITPENIDSKLGKITNIEKDKPEVEKEKNNTEKDQSLENLKKINVFVNSADFTLQNVCLKMGIPVMGVDGLQIRKIKNYIYKCTTCSTFIFDTSKKFCDFCGYPYLMKIGYNIYSNGDIKINDRKPEPRRRGNQFDLPKPSLSKKGVVYILAEDQIPKKGFGRSHNLNIDKILENYENMKEIPKLDTEEKNKSSKQYVWGYPRQNPNKPKKYYSKKK